MIQGISDYAIETIGSVMFWSALALIALTVVRVWTKR